MIFAVGFTTKLCPPRWPTKDAVLGEIRAFYDDGSSYGYLSQRLHALQAARQAELAGAPKEVVVGALLHDVGWKLSREAPSKECSMGADGISARPPEKGCIAERLGILTHCEIPEGADSARLRAQHDVIGGTWLRIDELACTCVDVWGHERSVLLFIACSTICLRCQSLSRDQSTGSNPFQRIVHNHWSAAEGSITCLVKTQGL